MRYFDTYKILKLLLKNFLLLCLLYVPQWALSQSSNYWSGNFNEESSLLSGAVVGGGAGPSAIYYNPADISEITESKLSINASLFSYDYFKAENAWGDDIDFISTRFVVVPRFVSYMFKPKEESKWSLEFAFLNNENHKVANVNSVDELKDVLKNLPGNERYNVYYRYENNYRDDWLGAGGSYEVNPNFYLGTSMFVSFKSLNYSYLVDIEAGHPNSWNSQDEEPFFTAKYKDQEYLKFNNYRVLWKFAFLHKINNVSIGLNLTTPSLNVYADGKRVMSKKSQSNISNPETNEPVPNLLISDYAEVKDMSVNYKSPLSIAAGLTWNNHNKTQTVYTTVEYFAKIDPYKMVEANENADQNPFTSDGENLYNDWLTFVWGARSVFNAAVGYRWIVKNNMMLMGGFRTDFNYRKDYDYYPLEKMRTIKGFQFDRYHLTGGISAKIKGQDVMAGLQYTLGYQDNVQQFINLSDPVEYNPETGKALQGVQQNNMKTVLNSISLYFGATFNFGTKKD